MAELKQIIAGLKRTYGAPALPTAKGPFELVLWENACYLLPDDRRAAVFAGLRKQVGLNASAILKADPDILLRWLRWAACVPRYGYFAGRRLHESP